MGRRRRAGGHRFRVFETGLTEMDVKVEEPGGDDDAAVRDTLGLGAFQPHDGLKSAVRDDDLAGTFATRHRVHEPGLLELEPLHDRADDGTLSGVLGCAHRAASPEFDSCAPARR